MTPDLARFVFLSLLKFIEFGASAVWSVGCRLNESRDLRKKSVWGRKTLLELTKRDYLREPQRVLLSAHGSVSRLAIVELDRAPRGGGAGEPGFVGETTASVPNIGIIHSLLISFSFPA
jgi:hypothetical protein